ncbi:MAG: hypothetical protein J6T10_14455 [Methanobrevibacter sp.]|nr:hypothetical protein [Methanobrevibacter sp.]
MEIRREEFELLMKHHILENGNYYITCKHKKSKRKKYHIALDTVRYKIAKLMKNREAPREIVDWFYGRFSNKKKVGA